MIIATAVIKPHKLAIITGTSSGIGAGLAQTLLEREWFVLGLARRKVEFDSPFYQHIQTDLSDHQTLVDSTLHAIRKVLDQPGWSRVALVNNAAAIGTLRGLTDIPAAKLSQLFDINVIAPGLLMGFIAKHVSSRTWLRIVNVSSGAAHRGIPGLADYSGSKAALRLMGMSLSAEFEASQRSTASVMSYEPGIVDTEMQVQARQPDDDFPSQQIFQDFHTSGSLQPVSAVIDEMIVFLESAECSFFSEKRFQPA